MKIEGFFGNLKTANETVQRLQASGFQSASVDMNEHYQEDRNIETNLPGTETSTNLSGLVLKSDSSAVGGKKSPLMAASPMASGLGSFDEVADVNCRVVVEAGPGSEEKAKKIVEEMGGTLDNPNVKRPVSKDDREIEIHNAIAEIARENSK